MVYIMSKTQSLWLGCPNCNNLTYKIAKVFERGKYHLLEHTGWYDIKYECTKCGCIYDRRLGLGKNNTHNVYMDDLLRLNPKFAYPKVR